METAPFRRDLAEGPEGGHFVWAPTSDGVTIRAGGWQSGEKGTVLIFTGRTEYIEKYGRVAKDLAAAGYATATCDWRGQGMSDRIAEDPNIGHVDAFGDYQRDVEAFLGVVRHMGLPEPYHLIGHSMGGAIGLRALTDGLPVKRAVFSGPMWGIRILNTLGPIATILLEGANLFRLGGSYAPGTNGESYVLKQGFDGNGLTHDAATFSWLQAHVHADARLGLGGPSMNWMREAKQEMARLADITSVPCPTLALVGNEDNIVAQRNVLHFAEPWADGRAELIEGARHEAMMETPAIREVFMSKTLAHLAA